MSFQTLLTNHTPFAADKFVLVTPHGQESTLIVLAATFVSDGPHLVVAAEQPAIRILDTYAGSPGTSSIQLPHELALYKPLVDVLVVGHAWAPAGRPTTQTSIRLALGDIDKTLSVVGDRGPARDATRPRTFVKLPLVWERAFGGTNQRSGRGSPQNPIGVGLEDIPGSPNFEYPTNAHRADPAGLSPVSPAWQPRRSLAGTYDKKWLDERWPLLPVDFDPTYEQVAPQDQQSRTIKGGESAALIHLTEDGEWRFRLPSLVVPVHLAFKRTLQRAELRLDTVLIEPDLRSVRLTARYALETDRKAGPPREIILGHMTSAWRRARSTGRRYLDFHGTRGVDRDTPDYHR